MIKSVQEISIDMIDQLQYEAALAGDNKTVISCKKAKNNSFKHLNIIKSILNYNIMRSMEGK